MAKLNTSYSYADIGVAINRSNGQPLDATTIWKTGSSETALELAKAYAQTGQAYVGQIISVVDTKYDSKLQKTVADKVTAYIIKDENGNLEEVGATVEVDTSLISSSTNPVAGSAVYNAISQIRQVPEANSTNKKQILMVNDDGTVCWGSITDIIEDGEIVNGEEVLYPYEETI